MSIRRPARDGARNPQELCGFIVACCLLILISGCAGGPPAIPATGIVGNYEYVKQYIRWLTNRQMRKHDVVGLSLALVDDQRVVWAEGFGMADRERAVPATAETLYRVGSITKLFTATAAMQLVEQGRLDVDRPVAIYLPEWTVKTRVPGTSPITLRHLLTHHSGLPPNMLRGMWSSRPAAYTSVLDDLKDTYVLTAPDQVFSYSNIGMTVVGAAIERVSGEPYATYVTKAVLRPLGMDSASLDQGAASSPLMSQGYREGEREEEAKLRDLPAGGLNASVLDLARFIQMVCAQGRAGDRRILQADTVAEMLRVQNGDVSLDLDFHSGLGWMLSSLGEMDLPNVGTVAHHGGATFLFQSQLVVVPEHKLGLVVLCNSSTCREVVSDISKELLKLAVGVKTGIIKEETTPSDEPGPPLSPEQAAEYQGWYNTIAGLVHVTQSGGHLDAEVMGKSFRLVPHQRGEVGLEYRVLGLFRMPLGELDRLRLSRAAVAGRDILIARDRRPRRMLVGERLGATPIPAAWLRSVGTYEIIHLGEDLPYLQRIRLSVHDGFLVMSRRVTRPEPLEMSHALAPVSETEATVRGVGFGLGETIDVVHEGGEERLRYAGYVLKRAPHD